MENKDTEQKWRKVAIGAGIAFGAVLVLLIALGIVRGSERAAYDAEMRRLEKEYESLAAARDDSETSGKDSEVDMTDEYSYGGNAAANLSFYEYAGKLAKMMGDETVYYYADNSGKLYRKSLSDSEWELIVHREGAGKNIFNLNVDNIGGQYVYYEYEDKDYFNYGIYRLDVETLEEEEVVSVEGHGIPKEPRLMCGKLYYLSRVNGTKDSIYCMDLETLSKELLFEPKEDHSYIRNFCVTGEEIIFTMDNAIFKLTPQGELSTIYNGELISNMFVCGGYIFLVDSESEYIFPVFKLDFNGNVIETYDMKEKPHAILTSVQGEDLYFFTFGDEDKKILRMRTDSEQFEVVLDYPDKMDFNFANIVDETMLLGFSTNTDGGKLEDLYALPVDSAEMTLEDCVHLCQKFTAK